MEKPPSSLKRHGSRRGTSTSSKTVSFSDQHPPPRSVLIVVANGSESIDVMDCSKILSLFGMKVSLAAPASCETFVELHGGMQILADYTLEQATEHQPRWSIILLPGGMAAVYELIQNHHFLALIENHVQQRGIIAAAGASATCLLPELGHVDKHGPTCMPSPITKIVTRESDLVWTTPGLNTAAHLALALGEELYGTPRAKQVAASLTLPPLSLDDLAKTNNETRAGEESSVEQGTNGDAQSDNTTFGDGNALFLCSPVSRSQAFSSQVWKTLRDLGWTRKEKDGLNYFFQPNIKQESEGTPGVDWFISYAGVVKYLESHADPKLRALADEYHNGIAAFKEPKTRSTQEPEVAPRLEKERKVEDVNHVESTRATETDSFVDRLFDHVAWPRLQALGWKRRKRKPTPDSSHAYRYKPPGAKGSALNSPDRVVQFLMRDGYWRSKTASLRIVDLFRSCQRIRQEMTSNADSPECVEQETKLRMPALMSY